MTAAKKPAVEDLTKEIAAAVVSGDVEIRSMPLEWLNAHRLLGKKWRELPAGTPAIVQRDNGSLLETTTTGKPYDLGGQPVVCCEGIAGPYHLRCIYLRAPKP